MISLRKLCGLLVLLAFSANLQQEAEAQSSSSETKPFTNLDIISLSKAGCKSETLLQIIGEKNTHFDTTPAALIEPKQRGVSDDVILAMLKQTNSSTKTDSEVSRMVQSEQTLQSNDLTVFVPVNDLYKRYEAPSLTSFEVPISWLRAISVGPGDIHHRSVTFEPENDQITLPNGTTFLQHMIFFGTFHQADSPGFVQPRLVQSLQKSNPKLQITTAWKLVNIAPFNGTIAEVYSADYLNTERPGHTEVGIVAIQRTGSSYYYWMMGCDSSEKQQWLPVYHHVLESIRRREKK